jgi:hypothetical protein
MSNGQNVKLNNTYGSAALAAALSQVIISTPSINTV